jgi:hypothetical protein
MNDIDENKKKALQVLKSHEYEIDEFEETILGSKYCERDKGGVMCLLIEVTPLYNEIRVWGEYASYHIDSNLSKLISALNKDLIELIS